MLIIETPWYAGKLPIIMLARKNGRYIRPIVGSIIDIRAEDCLPPSINYVNVVARLPNVHNQREKYIIATAAVVDRVGVDRAEVERYLANGYIELPSDSSSQFWKYSQKPWWEFAAVMDEYDGYIKAPLKPRSGEPHPDQIDEKLDEIAENQGQIKAISPQTIKRNMHNYDAKLRRALA